MPKQIKKFLETFLFGSYDSYIYITYWSILHFISGILVAAVLVAKGHEKTLYWKGFLLHTLWEVWQVVIGMSKPWKLNGHNAFLDIVTDTILFMLGMIVYRVFTKLA